MRPALAFGITACITLLILLILEWGTRIIGPDTLVPQFAEKRLLDERDGRFPYVNRAQYQGVVWGATVGINTQHLRGKELSTADQSRILLLGDSVIFGPGLPESDAAHNIWPPEIDPQPILMNAGTVGYTTRHERSFLELFGAALQPDVVVLAYCLNDPLPVSRPSLIVDSETRSTWKQKMRTWLDKHSYFYLLMRGTLRLNWHNYRYPTVIAPLYSDENWERVRNEIRGILNWCQNRSIPLVIAVFPYQDQLLPDRPSDDRPQRLFKAFAAAHQVFLLDLRDTLTAQDYLFYDPLHLNARGMKRSMYRLAAIIQPLLSATTP